MLNRDGEKLVDPQSGEFYPVVHGIPRFCDADNYSESFGFQWNLFNKTQLDVYSGTDHSEQRFYSETGWDPSDLSHYSVLEVGSGAGRFSEVFLRTTTGVLHSIDYSSAVDANHTNNAVYRDRLQLAQASIYEIPYLDNSFDRVFCLGVLQHTPSFEDSVTALIAKTKVGGEIVVDFYPINGWYTKFHSKYFLRPFSKRLPKPFLLRLIRLNISWMLLLFDTLCFLRVGFLTRFIPITDLRGFPKGLNSYQRREWAVMDTFDGLSPEFDNPQRVKDVARMFNRGGCEVTFAGLATYPAGCSTVVRAIKRSS
ncbi:bifunctional 2-polyprenyl-6-hydroxyphenol methylase/3-demethylubiquinol 3-O-methyltransferase UbiG [Synechococcus sp. MIT S9508]|uniref:class I SAM-dependent methyltransferase n=1 Tax=Synechococcus sp. MIT S9508 TaxID=1801629 RepID=UPI0018D32D84|nr:class I SAM-dependent methyltransferase [Synechococcus sp. MIT S9508]